MALKKSQKSLKNWTKQKWSTPSGKKSSETGEVYAPKKTIDRLRDFDSNAEIYSCMELLRLNIRKENLPTDKTELELLKYLKQINFGKSLENYQDFINE